jgi:hypothetical protein
MKGWHESDVTPEVFFARQRRKKQFWLAVAILAIATIVAALL